MNELTPIQKEIVSALKHQKASGGKAAKKRNDRKKMSFRDVEVFE